MENNKPKFRLEDIAKIPEDIKQMIKEIIAEISHPKKLQPLIAGVGNLEYSCDPHCDCNTECRGHDECNYCRCVSYSKCDCYDYCSCDSDLPACPCDRDCGCFMYECSCETR